MKINKVKLECEHKGILPFEQDELGDVVILAGENGSGKTRLLNMLGRYIQCLEAKDKIMLWCNDEAGGNCVYSTAASIKIANYSHYDAVLQSASKFPPYVIGKAKELLSKCDYEETALNALLVIHDMAYGYSEEFKDLKKFEEFSDFISKNFGIELVKTEKGICLFGQDVDEAKLSPGQQYLLRIAVACFFNRNEENLIIFLDEPELHLHPKAMIHMLEQMRVHFEKSQFWISTHSVELISYVVSTVDNSTVLQLDHGNVSLLRSDSSQIIEKLLGYNSENIYLQQFYNLPDQYACIRFALECFGKADVKSGKKGDPQQEMLTSSLYADSLVIDYGAGKGRLLEQLAMETPELLSQIQYYAFNIPDFEDADECKKILCQTNIDASHYYDDVEKLKRELSGKASHVFLVNVLHEIPPEEWFSIFIGISKLLTEHGKLYIVERKTLSVGEAPYDCGFLMVTDNAIEELFSNFEIRHHRTNTHIVQYEIERKNLMNISNSKVQSAVEVIKQDAITEIEKLKKKSGITDLRSRYHRGIDLAFWLNQYANASLILSKNII